MPKYYMNIYLPVFKIYCYLMLSQLQKIGVRLGASESLESPTPSVVPTMNTDVLTRKKCFRYLKLMSPLNAAIYTTISYTLRLSRLAKSLSV